MKKHNKFFVIALLVSLPFAANAYDADQAEHILNTVTGQMNQQFFLTKPCKIEAVEVLKMLEQKEKYTDTAGTRCGGVESSQYPVHTHEQII